MVPTLLIIGTWLSGFYVGVVITPIILDLLRR